MRLQAVILAGGLGTRLRSRIGDAPKVMAPVAGRPFLEHVLEALASCGFGRVILAVGRGGDVVRSHFGDRFGSLSVDYAVEREALGTGGAARLGLARADPGPCFVMNGDTWLELDFAAMHDRHVRSAASISIAVREVPDVSRYGALAVEGGRIVRFNEKGRSGPGVISAGVYLLQGDLFDRFGMRGSFSIENDFFVPHAAALRPHAFPASGRFIDIGVPEDYERAQRMFDRR